MFYTEIYTMKSCTIVKGGPQLRSELHDGQSKEGNISLAQAKHSFLGNKYLVSETQIVKADLANKLRNPRVKFFRPFKTPTYFRIFFKWGLISIFMRLSHIL